MIQIFALVILGIWALSDYKIGHVHNIALVIPVILLALMSPAKFMAVFVPIFVVLSAIFIIIGKKAALGFADVVGIPFALMSVFTMSITAILAFVMVFALLIKLYTRERYDTILGMPVRDNIILMPILFYSFLFALPINLIIGLLF